DSGATIQFAVPNISSLAHSPPPRPIQLLLATTRRPHMRPCLTRNRHQTDHGAVSMVANLCGRAAAVSAVALAALLASMAPARADTVTDWNANASTAIVVTAGQPPPVAVLSFAMVQGAVYDAVNAIDRGHRSYLPQPAAAPGASEDAAAATAAHDVLAWLFPLQQATLDALYHTSLGGIPETAV